MPGRAWDRHDLVRFIEEYPHTPVAVLCRRYGRTARSIASTASRLRLRQETVLKASLGRLARLGKKGRGQYRVWTDSDRVVALALYGRIPTKSIARRLGRSERSVRSLAIRVGKKSFKRGQVGSSGE